MNGDVLDNLAERLPNLVAVFYDNEAEDDLKALEGLEEIDDDCDNYGIPLVKVYDVEKAKDAFGLDDLPAMMYWKDSVPSIFVGNVGDSSSVLEWIVSRKAGVGLELVSEEILEDMVDAFEYVFVYFQPYCKEGDTTCEENKASIMEGVENIDDDINDIGLVTVTTKDIKYARKLGITKLPCLGLFRNGDFKIFEGDNQNEYDVLKWLSSIDTLEISDQIEEVNEDILANVLKQEDDVLVFFYNEEDKDSEDILLELETIDDNLDVEEVEFVKISVEDAQRRYGLTQVPALVFFEFRVPEVFPGDLKNDDEILAWITSELTDLDMEEVRLRNNL